MRSAAGFAVNTAAAAAAAAATPPVSSAVLPQQQQHSPWRSPVPYLFGGLAAMLGLIAFALLILACSYWKLSGYLESGNGVDGDVESGDSKPGDADAVKSPPAFEEKIVVIMAGDEKPTFLATPKSSRTSSFGDNNKLKGLDSVKEGREEEGGGESQRSQDHGHGES